jgi:hypothetical protein
MPQSLVPGDVAEKLWAMSKNAGVPPFEIRNGLPVLPSVPDRQYHYEGLRTKLARLAIRAVAVVGLLIVASAVPVWVIWTLMELRRSLN